MRSSKLLESMTFNTTWTILAIVSEEKNFVPIASSVCKEALYDTFGLRHRHAFNIGSNFFVLFNQNWSGRV